MQQRWINLVSGVPTVSNFSTTQGQGSPLCLDTTTGAIYYLTAAGVVQQANQTIFGILEVISPSFSQVLQYATVNGVSYNFVESVLGLTNPLAVTSNVLLYSFGAEGVYTAGGVVTSRDFYIFDDVAGVYRLYTDETGILKLGGTNAKTNPALTIAVNGALTVPEVAAASVPAPAAGFQSLFIDTADHKLKRKDSAATVTIIA